MAKRSLTQTCVLSLLLIVLAGCEANHYEIELSPEEDGMRRQLKVGRFSGGDERAFDQKELESLAKTYGVPVPKALTEIPPFAGRFVDRMPQDVGGAGWHVPLRSPLGTSHAYMERFRGTIDMVAVVEDLNGKIDTGVNHLVGWLKFDLKGEPYAEKAAAALDKQLRRDLKNLVLYALSGTQRIDEKPNWENLTVRVSAYLAERGYFQPKDGPALARAFEEAQNDDGSRLAEFTLRWLATQSGIAPEQPLPARLKRLKDPVVLRASLRNYAKASPPFAALLDKWERSKLEGFGKAMPDPLLVFAPLIEGLAVLYLKSDVLEIRLHTKVAPFMTNGNWSAEKKTVSWSQPITESKSFGRWPALCYAFWSEPDVKYQEARFRRVVLKEAALAQYCTWYAGLTAEERQEWDALLASEPAGDPLLKRIELFRFRGDPAVKVPEHEKTPPPPPRSLADWPKALLKGALEMEKK